MVNKANGWEIKFMHFNYGKKTGRSNNFKQQQMLFCGATFSATEKM